MMRASGDSRFRATHHLFSGSTTDSVPILLSQVGISGAGLSAACDSPVPHNPTTASDTHAPFIRSSNIGCLRLNYSRAPEVAYPHVRGSVTLNERSMGTTKIRAAAKIFAL